MEAKEAVFSFVKQEESTTFLNHLVNIFESTSMLSFIRESVVLLPTSCVYNGTRGLVNAGGCDYVAVQGTIGNECTYFPVEETTDDSQVCVLVSDTIVRSPRDECTCFPVEETTDDGQLCIPVQETCITCDPMQATISDAL